MTAADPRQRLEQIFPGGGELGARMRAHRWGDTSLGDPARWPETLRSTLGLCLDSAFPIAIYWGEDLALLYNDAWRPILGDKHPWALGRPAREVWPEIWDAIDPVFRDVRASAKGVFNHDSLLAMNRYGYVEECYFDYTFNPIRDGHRVGGIFNVVVETTYRVIGERRARAQRDFAGRLGAAKSIADVVALAAASLSENTIDVPFALLYRIDSGGRIARLEHAIGFAGGERAPREVRLEGDDPWALGKVARSGATEHIADLGRRFAEPLPGGPWPEPAREALVLPVSASRGTMPQAILVAGVSPRRALDLEYRSFFESLAAHMGRALASAEAYENERRRAEALAELDRAKTAFFSNVSHEFRTPLTLMLGPVEDLLAKTGEAMPDVRDALAVVHRNGQRLLKLVNTLLDFARIEAGRAQACYELTDLAALTADLASSFRSACERAGLRLAVDCPPSGEAFVDREMWEKVVLNLLSNAFKFTLDGEIAVAVRRDDATFRLTVRDTGTGIPQASLARLFERFHRVEGAQGRSHEGSGIGLALVQELVKLHGGTIEVRSAPGRGSTFTVSIPAGAAHLPAERIRAAREATSTALRAGAFVDEALSWLPAQASAQPALPRDAPRVLLADDNADLRDYARRLLAERYEVEAVADGAAALAAARVRRPDLVVTDVMMPSLDGFGLIRALRADAKLRDVPVIALSARAGEEARIEGLGRGADDYLSKPFSARELLVRCEALLRSQRALRESETRATQLSALYELTDRLQRAGSEAEIHAAALDAILRATGCARASILLFDGEGVMRFVAWRGLSEEYRRAVEGHTPWRPDDSKAEPIGIEDVERADLDQPLRAVIRREGIGALAFIPLLGSRRLIGKFMLYYDAPHAFTRNEFETALAIGAHVAFGVERQHIEATVRESEQRFRTLADSAPVLIWVNGPGGREYVNRWYLEFFGVREADVRGLDRSRLVHPEGRDAFFASYAAAMREGRNFEGDVRLLRHDGQYRWMRVIGVPRPRVKGAFAGDTGCAVDITEIREAGEQLRDADRRKDEFIAMLSHELRNPLAPLRSGLELMRLNEPPGTDGQVRAMMERQVGHLVRLVDDLLEASRISRGLLELRRQPVLLGEVLRNALEASQPLVREAGHRLELDLPAEPLWVQGDGMRLAQCFANLLNNAARYTPQGGRITLRAARGADASVQVSVRDSGTGFSAETQKSLFQMFARGPNSSGLGIGLALVRRLVEMHGGSVQAHSEGEGCGAEFTVTLPLGAPPARPGEPAPAAKGAGFRVLVADDNRDAAQSLAALLRALGNDVHVAYDGVEAVEAAQVFLPHVILLDIGMPRLDGYGAARRIRRDLRGRRARIVALTGWGQDEDRRKAAEAGFDDHLVKPAELDALRRVLDSAAQPGSGVGDAPGAIACGDTTTPLVDFPR